MKKFLKVILWFLLGILVLLLVSGIFAWSKFGPLVKGAASVQKLDEGLYYMEYRGDDGFEGLMAAGGGRSAADLVGYVMNFLSKGYYNPPAPTPVNAVYGCSALTVRTPENSVLMGRNFDFSSAIESVSQPTQGDGFLGTAWTVLMDLTNRKVTYFSRRHFDNPFHFAITN